MDVLTLTMTVLRRWYVAAPILGVTLAAMVLVALQTERYHQVTGSYLLATEQLANPGQQPAPDEDDGPSNVEVAPGVSTGAIADVVSGGEVLERLRAAGATADYDVSVSGNRLRVSAAADEPDPLVPTVTGVLEAIEAEVERRQRDEGLTESERVVVEVLAAPTDASIQERSGDADAAGDYTAFGSVRLVEPTAEETINPYASMSFSLGVLEVLLAGEGARSQIAEQVGVAPGSMASATLDDGEVATAPTEYAVVARDTEGAPLVNVLVTSVDPQLAQRTYDAVVAFSGTELDARQAALGVPSEERVGLQQLSTVSEPRALGRELDRPLITILGVGGVAAIAMALLTENVMAGRGRRRATASAPHPDDDRPLPVRRGRNGHRERVSP